MAIRYRVGGETAGASLEALVGQRSEAEEGGVVDGRLFCVAYPPVDVVVAAIGVVGWVGLSRDDAVEGIYLAVGGKDAWLAGRRGGEGNWGHGDRMY